MSWAFLDEIGSATSVTVVTLEETSRAGTRSVLTPPYATESLVSAAQPGENLVTVTIRVQGSSPSGAAATAKSLVDAARDAVALRRTVNDLSAFRALWGSGRSVADARVGGRPRNNKELLLVLTLRAAFPLWTTEEISSASAYASSPEKHLACSLPVQTPAGSPALTGNRVLAEDGSTVIAEDGSYINWEA